MKKTLEFVDAMENTSIPSPFIIALESDRLDATEAGYLANLVAELAALCRTDGEGEPELAARIDGVRHSLCTLENPLWYSHRRAALADKSGEGRMLALIVRE